MAKYSQGICGDGAAILEDGRMMTVDEIVERLNQLDEELTGWVKSHDEINNRLIAMTEFYEG